MTVSYVIIGWVVLCFCMRYMGRVTSKTVSLLSYNMLEAPYEIELCFDVLYGFLNSC